MATISSRLAQNVDGEFYVDSSCIDCDTCRFVAPSTFIRSDDVQRSYVHHQPRSDEEQTRAQMALVACPTASIGTVHRTDARSAAARFPEPVADNIHYCGFASESSFGASSYLVVRPEGNWMVDSPRAAGPLLRRIGELGGVRRMLLTHRDDVADHAKFAKRFGCERAIHRIEAVGGLAGVELQLDIDEPAKLDDQLWAIPLPGHTRGSIAYLYRDQYLFSGDHLWWSPPVGGLQASKRVCWYNWREQIQSMERLLDFRFEWVLPGHGRRYQAESPDAMHRELSALIERMRLE